MVAVIINPGTGPDPSATLANAEKIARQICEDMSMPQTSLVRAPQRDRGGFFGFNLKDVELDIPGDEPEQFFKSRPFESRRMYVDGNSWLYSYATRIIAEHLSGDLLE